jgi:hypothetical protein
MKTRKTSMPRLALAGTVALLATGLSTTVMAQDPSRDQTQARDRDQDRLQDPIYGNQLMTLQERNEYRTKMRSLKTQQEREAYRLEHHQQMQERARTKGITLPDEPPAKGMGTGPGPAAGPGPGMGSGMGGGAGPGGKK